MSEEKSLTTGYQQLGKRTGPDSMGRPRVGVISTCNDKVMSEAQQAESWEEDTH